MDYKYLLEKVNRLEYHQSLLLNMLSHSNADFYKLVIEKQLSQSEVEQFYKLCEELSIRLEEQKAEGFVYFHPLFEEFKQNLHPNISVEEVIKACLGQQIFQPLMLEFKNYV